MSFDIDLAVFDMAGTTVQEHGLVYAALAAATGADDVTPWLGADKREAVRALVGEPRAEDAYADFRRRLDAAYAERPPVPLPGVPELLADLRARGIRVALTTGFDREIVAGLLTRLGWSFGVVDAVVSAEDVAAGRPAPYMIFRAMEATGVHDVARILVAGDTVLDLQAGANAGAGAVVGVLSGSGSATALGAQRHTHLLDSVTDIAALLPAPMLA